jgi:hypothetical protein
MKDSAQEKSFEGWAILDLFGHRRLGGYVRLVELAGAPFLRIDIPGPTAMPDPRPAAAFGVSFADGEPEWEATQLYSPQAVYCLTPTTAEVALAVAANNRPAPVHRWELPALVDSRRDEDEDDCEDGECPY